MKTFRVWLRPLGDSCRISVEGEENARWLIGRLNDSYMFRKLQLRALPQAENICTFEVPQLTPESALALEARLARYPEVELMREPN